MKLQKIRIFFYIFSKISIFFAKKFAAKLAKQISKTFQKNFKKFQKKNKKHFSTNKFFVFVKVSRF